MATVKPLRMPKWGLSMQEGTIVQWWKDEAALVAAGDELVDIETSKITNQYESPESGRLRRIVAKPGETLPVGALIGVVADDAASDSEIDAFVADFQATFTPGAADGEGGGAYALSKVAADGRTLHVGRAGAGDGTPIVLLHGFAGDLNTWLFNIDALAAAAPVIALDLPGHGESSKDVGEGALATLANSVGAALDALNVAKAHLVGHSLGGAVAARLAADRPALAQSLTLICPALLPGTSASEAFLTGLVEARRARDVKPLLEQLFADPGLVSKDMVEAIVKLKRIDGVEDALGLIRDRLLGPEDAASLRADLGKIARARVIASKSDRIVGAPDPGALPSGFTVIWVDGVGHMPHLEKAAEVNALLLEALRW